jgi:hypothetical protein
MDVVAHMLWAGAATVLVARRVTVRRRTAAAVIAFAALPDLLQFLPLLAWVGFGDGTWPALLLHAVARPGGEADLPAVVALVSHHLHCMTHSAVVAGVLTAAVWLAVRTLWLPLLGWWSHILIDVWTHSADFYPVPVLYPITYRGFDGLAWNEPWFMVLNYAAIALFFAWAIRPCVRSRGTKGDARTMSRHSHRGPP